LFAGLCFLSVGATMVFGRRWTTFDPGQGLVVRSWGALVPMKRQELSLRDYSGIVLQLERGNADRADSYAVRLKARSGGGDLNLYRCAHFGQSRERAVHLARFLRLPLTDITTERASTLAPDQLEATYQQKLLAGSSPADALQPITMRSLVREGNGLAEVTIPGPKFRPITLVPFAIPAGVMAWFLPGILRFFDQTRTPPPVQFAFVSFVAFVFVGLPGLNLARAVLGASRRRTTITASPEGIVIEEHGAGRNQATRIPAGEILDLDCGTAEDTIAAVRAAASARATQTGSVPWRFEAGAGSAPWWFNSLTRLVRSKGIIVKAKSGLYSLAAGLPDDELRYVHAVLARALEKGP